MCAGDGGVLTHSPTDWLLLLITGRDTPTVGELKKEEERKMKAEKR